MNNPKKINKSNINKINNIISIEDFEKSSLKTQRINSSYSILSLLINLEYHKKFISNFQIKILIQKNYLLKFTFFEKCKLKKIKYLKELRNQIQFENKTSRNKSDIHNKKNNNFYSEEISYILIEDLKSFERFKNRNDKELLDLIENEVNKNIFKLIMKRKQKIIKKDVKNIK